MDLARDGLAYPLSPERPWSDSIAHPPRRTSPGSGNPSVKPQADQPLCLLADAEIVKRRSRLDVRNPEDFSWTHLRQVSPDLCQSRIDFAKDDSTGRVPDGIASRPRERLDNGVVLRRGVVLECIPPFPPIKPEEGPDRGHGGFLAHSARDPDAGERGKTSRDDVDRASAKASREFIETSLVFRSAHRHASRPPARRMHYIDNHFHAQPFPYPTLLSIDAHSLPQHLSICAISSNHFPHHRKLISLRHTTPSISSLPMNRNLANFLIIPSSDHARCRFPTATAWKFARI